MRAFPDPADAEPCNSCCVRSRTILIIGAGLTLLGVVTIPFPGPGGLALILGILVLLTGGALAEVADGSERRTGARRWSSYLVVAGIFWVVPAVALLVGYLTLPDYNASGQCEGIGFGCTLTPKDGAHFAALFFYPVLVVVGLLIMAVVAATRAWRQRSR